MIFLPTKLWKKIWQFKKIVQGWCQHYLHLKALTRNQDVDYILLFFLKRRVEFHSSHFYNWKLEYQDISIMKYEVLSYMSWTFASEQNVNDSRRSMTKEGAFFDTEKCSPFISRLWPLWRTNEQYWPFCLKKKCRYN